jgi:UDP-N-acetylmuramoylalanine--D-glutamate ligase
MLNFKNKKVLVLGFSTQGVAAAQYLAKCDAKVYLSEVSPKKEQDTKKLEELGVNVEFGGHSEEFIDNSEIAILSPSIPQNSEIIQRLKNKNIEFISDIELAFRIEPEKIVAITGTNGKTTTTMLTKEVLSSKFKTEQCGNIGKSPCDFLGKGFDYLVCETSSYQLNYSPTFAPKIGIFTNLTPDHISFHGSMEEYFNAKAKMFKNMDENSYAILNYDDLKVRELGKSIKAKVYYFSASQKADLFLDDDIIKFKDENIISTKDIKLCGKHNIQNIMCAIAAAKILGIENEKIAQKIKDFRAPEHRCEFVRNYKGIDFYNDSKATNPEATIVALSAFEGKNVCLIAGGRDKNTTLDEFCAEVKKYIKTVVLLGEAKERFKKALQEAGFKDIIETETFEQAIDKATDKNPQVVLLSPACASFDMFKSFEHRGAVFKNYVLAKK